MARFTPEQAAAIAAEALDSPHLFNARYHHERGDVRHLGAIGNHIRELHPMDPPITDAEVAELMTTEQTRRDEAAAKAAAPTLQ